MGSSDGILGVVVDCDNVQAYEHRVQTLQVVRSPWSIFIEYVISTWLNPHKEKFVKRWTNKVMHLGNTTSNSYAYVLLVIIFVFLCRV